MMRRRFISPLASLCLALSAALPFAASAQPDSLQPTAAPPTVSSQAPGQYYTLLLKWSRDVAIGPVAVRVTYLDPPLYLAWLRQASPEIDQKLFEEKFSGFPKVLRFRAAYQALDRGVLRAKDWKLTLRSSDGAAIPASEGRRIAPADLKSGPNGDYWEDDFDYQFPVSDGFLTSGNKGFAISLSGPAGEGKASWIFGVAAESSATGDGYVPYLGEILSIVCVALLVALFVTRPPRAGIA